MTAATMENKRMKCRLLRGIGGWVLPFLAAGWIGMVAIAQRMPSNPDVAPSEFITIRNEPLKLAAVKPNAWASGTPLPGLLSGDPRNGIGRITEEGALDPKSLILMHNGQALVEGKDYLVDAKWGTLGLAPESSVTADDTVFATYRFYLLRLDSIVRTVDGKEFVRPGKSDVTAPHPPDLAAHEVRLANIYVPYASDGKSSHTDVLPVLEGQENVLTHSTSGRIPRTLAKLTAGETVKIVCWGDSITAGGDASNPDARYPVVFARMLHEKYPSARVMVKAVAAGGSTSRMWLYPERFPYPLGNAKLSFASVLNEEPDLVTIEFANDAYIDAPQSLPAIYNDIFKQLTDAGAEIVIVTPSFFNLDYMKFQSYREQDSRPYDFFVRKFADDHRLGIADVSSRWEHLFKEGIPYFTYLENSINHPDNRGHLMFAEELMKNFQ